MNETERNSLNNPYEVTPEENKGYKEKRYTWAETYQTDEIDKLANDAGADAELSDQPAEEENEPEIIKQLRSDYAGKGVFFLSRDIGKKQEIPKAAEEKPKGLNMDDGTKNIDLEINKTNDQVPEDEPEIVEPRKLNRHERRKRAKLARMLAMKEKQENERKKK